MGDWALRVVEVEAEELLDDQVTVPRYVLERNASVHPVAEAATEVLELDPALVDVEPAVVTGEIDAPEEVHDWRESSEAEVDALAKRRRRKLVGVVAVLLAVVWMVVGVARSRRSRRLRCSCGRTLMSRS
ncbi:MAG: hypothetical protein HC927_00875 [Deltaproteobacteria bacterium]|nr:hypothetical protein [Deltaproteobacteria bacterium]